jgi:hypothetical protein
MSFGLINYNKIILDLCGGSGAWSQPYKDAGYDVRIVDARNGYDIRLEEKQFKKVYGILSAPPCTDLASSGARWWDEKGDEALLEALSIADACLRMVVIYKPVFWALENPVGRLVNYYGNPRLTFDPCDYGDPWTKKTLVWGYFKLPKKTPVKPTMGSLIHKMPDSKGREERRSETPQGFAKAFFCANR